MRGDQAGGESAAARARELQPSVPSVDECALDVPVSVSFAGMRSKKERREARELQAALDRRMADQQLLQLLARNGFKGPRYDMFANDLARYGMSVLRAWMYSGYIFSLVSERGFGLNPHELDLERLRTDSDLRGELATMTIAKTLPRFRERAFVQGGWTVEGGAGITTYFMGATLYDFPNEFRAHRAAEARQRRAQRLPYLDEELTDGVEHDVVGRQHVLDKLKGVKDPRTRAIVALTLDGYTQDEIRELVGSVSERAVEGALHRWRKKAQAEALRERRGERD
jgi:hypothetical protein